MRATEQSGVRSGRPSIGWAQVFAVLAALAVQLSVLTASASADDLWLVEASQDEAVAAPVPVAGGDGTTSESPAADPVLDPEVTSPEPAAPPGLPATVESSQPAEPAAALPARPPSAEVDSPDVPHAGAPTRPAESSPATTSQIESTTPAVPEPLAPLLEAVAPTLSPILPPAAPEAPARARGTAPKHSRAGMGVATVAWERPGPLVSGVTVHAWGAVVKWRPPPVSLAVAPEAKTPAGATAENPVRETPPQHPPRVPRAPSSSVCGGTSSCGSAFLAMLPLFMGIVCLCASPFQRLSEAPALWRPTRFLSLRERPG